MVQFCVESISRFWASFRYQISFEPKRQSMTIKKRGNRNHVYFASILLIFGFVVRAKCDRSGLASRPTDDTTSNLPSTPEVRTNPSVQTSESLLPEAGKKLGNIICVFQIMKGHVFIHKLGKTAAVWWTSILNAGDQILKFHDKGS